jgi:protease IV
VKTKLIQVVELSRFPRSVRVTARARSWAGRWFMVPLLATGVLLTACHGRPKGAPQARPLDVLDNQTRNVVIDLTQSAPESAAVGGLFPLPVERTFAGLVSALEKQSINPAPGYLVRFGEHQFDWAQTEELGRLLARLRSPEHPVVCHGHGFSNSSMWLALTGCDEIWLSPAGSVDTVGLGGQSVYLKRLLERFKIKADFLHIGRYKSAAETFTEDGPSPEARESLESVLASIRSAWLAGAKAPGRDEAVVGALEAGPWVPKAAQAVGLVDHIGYESQARQRVVERSSAGEFESLLTSSDDERAAVDAAELLQLITGSSSSVQGAHVAILPAAGGISMGGGDSMSQEGITASGLTRAIRELKNDDQVKAVVLRIDSPGGSALASDLLWHELMELRKRKPLIASVGNVAASGGYYLACAAHRLIAEQTSIVGSIGVVGGKIVLDDALHELGVTAHTFSAKPGEEARQRAAYLSPLNSWDAATRQRVQEQMEGIYDLFIQRVAEARTMDPANVREHAEGRIWSGIQGKERGLVDEFGGLVLAVTRAKERAGLPADAPVVVKGPEGGLLELLGLGEDAEDGEVRAAVLRLQAARPEWLKAAAPHLLPHLQSLLPLLDGERVLAVSPFVFEAN